MYLKRLEMQGFKSFVDKTILDLYGVSMAKGYVIETNKSKMVSNYPNVIIPEISYSHDITSNMYTSNGAGIYLLYAGKLEFADEEKLTSLKVTKEDLLAKMSDTDETE